jgi:hypothetical protein
MKMKKKTDMKMIRVERSVFKTKKVMCWDNYHKKNRI